MPSTNIKNRINNPNAKFRFQKPGIQSRIGNRETQIKHRLGIKKTTAIARPPKKVMVDKILDSNDVRNKIIAKKRQNLKDARDRLAEIAKQGDARQKLNKMKVAKGFNNNNNQKVKKTVSIKPLMELKVQGQVSPRKQTSGLHGKTIIKAGALVRTVSGGAPPPARKPKQPIKMVAKPSGSNISRASTTGRFHPLKNNPNVVTIKNDKVPQQLRKTIDNRGTRSSNPQLKVKRSLQSMRPQPYNHSVQQGYSVPPQTIMQRPASNYEAPQPWLQPPMQIPMQEEVRPMQLRITTANNYMDYYTPEHHHQMQQPYNQMDMQYAVDKPLPPKRVFVNDGQRFRDKAVIPDGGRTAPSYNQFDEYTPSLPKKQVLLSSDIISRLDQPQRPAPEHKVLVTNLHRVVTLEDVEELFGNIGPIKYARIIRDGVAEVSFLNEDDAHRSVTVYHNRQLDGQPMNVTLMSKKNDWPTSSPPRRQRYKSPSPPLRRRPVVPSSSSASSSRPSTKSVLRSAGGSSSHNYDSSMTMTLKKRSQPNEVAPDISTIHEALFKGKSSVPMNNLQFYVKLPNSNQRMNK